MARSDIRPVLRAIFALCLAWPARGFATNHMIQIDEISAANGGDSSRQFVEIRVSDPGQTLWQHVAELAFFDASGSEIGTVPFTCNPVVVTSRSVLIATAEFAAMPGAPAPNFIMPALIAAPSGQVCFRSEHGPFPVNVCLAYGQFTETIPLPAGPPAPALPANGAMSLKRVTGVDHPDFFGEDNQHNADFALGAPAPANTGPGGPVECAACGDGVLDPGERCDDGNVADGDCCSSDCKLSAPRGDSCADDGDPCTDDVCDGFGVCSHDVDPCRQIDPVLGCVAAVSPGCSSLLPQKSTLSLTSAANPAGRKLKWSWGGTGGSSTIFGEPRIGTDYVLCVYEDSPLPELVLRAGATAAGSCAGQACWSATSTGFKYADREATPAGVTGIVLKTGGSTKLTVRGQGQLLDMPALPVTTPVRVQLKRSDGGACWEATYPTASKATTQIFKAKSN